VFELDPRAGELREKGMKIRLQGQPVEILAMPLERPGETITREELKRKLWPADTFVDFEQGLNNAMNRLIGFANDWRRTHMPLIRVDISKAAVIRPTPQDF
jgi:DNA-binding response OmpR family regulator